MAHIATPYEVQFVEYGSEVTDDLCILSLSECKEVAFIQKCYFSGLRNKPKEQATADFIVRACNLHEELVGALKRALEDFEDTECLIADGLDKEKLLRSLRIKTKAVQIALSKATKEAPQTKADSRNS